MQGIAQAIIGLRVVGPVVLLVSYSLNGPKAGFADGEIGMTTGERPDEKPDVSTPSSGEIIDDARIARRDAMRKAAAGAAAAGAVWAAPKVEGLTLVPDYAAAATGTGSYTFTTRTADGAPTYYDSVGDEVPACGGTGGSHWNVRAPDNPGAIFPNGEGNTDGTTRTALAPIGPAGNATLTVASGPNNQGELNETRNDISVTINIDPPWNKCRVSSVLARKCNGTNATININNNPAAGATNPAPFTVGTTIPGPQSNYLSFVQVTVTCS